jgi:hypothetical protein
MIVQAYYYRAGAYYKACSYFYKAEAYYKACRRSCSYYYNAETWASCACACCVPPAELECPP